jgi:hypothetical protein
MKLRLFALLIAAIIAAQTLIPEAEEARILSAVFMVTNSHKITCDFLLEELAACGHEVTGLSPIVSKRNITNMREIITTDGANFFKD